MLIRQADACSLPKQAPYRVGMRTRQQQYLVPRGLATFQFDRRLCQAQPLRDKRQQRGVCPAVDRWRGEANLQRVAVQAGHFAAFRAGLDMDGQREHAVGFAQPVEHGLQKNQQQLRENDGHQRRQVDGADGRHETLDRTQDGPRQLRHRLAQGGVRANP